jgi:peptidoglycan/xylan/chitin deacetylase (PgdA/CDA1 family)
MDATRELSANGVAPPVARRGRWVRSARKSARALAERVLPADWVIWREPVGSRTRAGGPGRVALTFDDGPTLLTPEYLDVLDGFAARATFFVVGEACARYPALVADIAARGHELAGHGYSHRRFSELSPDSLRDELFETRRLLPWDRCRTSLVRPPHGAVSLSSLFTSARAGFTSVLWSYDSCDARASTAIEVTRRFEAEAVPPGAIVLLHEGQRWTLEALPRVLQTLNEAGHELVTIGELLDR